MNTYEFEITKLYEANYKREENYLYDLKGTLTLKKVRS